MGTQNRGFVAAVVLTGLMVITAHNPARAGDYRASPAGRAAGSGAQIPGLNQGPDPQAKFKQQGSSGELPRFSAAPAPRSVPHPAALDTQQKFKQQGGDPNPSIIRVPREWVQDHYINKPFRANGASRAAAAAAAAANRASGAQPGGPPKDNTGCAGSSGCGDF
jgi:hypothetical protein